MITNNRPIVLQDVFLNQARRERIPVSVKMLDGAQLKGTVRGFDSFTVILDDDGGASQVIYKPVSYTHLDVYKRQGLSSPCSIGTVLPAV